MYFILHYQLSDCVAAIDSVTNRHLDNVARTIFPKWQETKEYIYDVYYVLSGAEKMPSMRCALCVFMFSGKYVAATSIRRNF